MNGIICDMQILRSIILESQHLLQKSTDSIGNIVSDICGLQYDPYPAIHLNQYMMLWNRKKDFQPQQLDAAAYKDFQLVETWAFRRNMFLIPSSEYLLYKKATKGIERWGSSDESWLAEGDSPEIRAAERSLKEALMPFDGLTANQIWEHLNLTYEWDQYRREHTQSYNLPVFRAFYRLVRRGDLITCGRKPGTFKEPVHILREKTGLPDWTADPSDEKEAIKRIIEKLTAALGVTDPVHISHISGFKAADILPVFDELISETRIMPLPCKIGRKHYYLHASKMQMLHEKAMEDCREVRLISPMDTIVRDKTWLKTFFDYSFSFEYFKKKGMKWPLSILVGNQFVGYMDCRMDWKTGKFIIKEMNILHPDFYRHSGIDAAIESLAAFHGAKEIVR